MVNVINFYLDDSGSRYPDHSPGKRAKHDYDWFALGGILIADCDEEFAREQYKKFCKKWDITYPLHSVEIRANREHFSWLRRCDVSKRNEFYEELYNLMRSSPVTGLACVIDRPGYNRRYSERYGDRRWVLCKTAFSVAVERAAKFARARDCRLRVFPERCNKKEDRLLLDYYRALKDTGMPFSSGTSCRYAPLSAADFSETLQIFRRHFTISSLNTKARRWLRWLIYIYGRCAWVDII